jgi:hypothetical protein
MFPRHEGSEAKSNGSKRQKSSDPSFAHVLALLRLVFQMAYFAGLAPLYFKRME